MKNDLISRQAAVDAFTDALNDVGILDAEDINTVLQMLPPAQPDRNEQERTGADLISRQAAIHAICRDGVRLERGGALMITISTAKQWAVDLLDDLPSVQPERKRGKWIYGEDEYGIDGYHCDKCGFFVPWDYAHKFINYIEEYNFCPNCGADMREVDDHGTD